MLGRREGRRGEMQRIGDDRGEERRKEGRGGVKGEIYWGEKRRGEEGGEKVKGRTG